MATAAASAQRGVWLLTATQRRINLSSSSLSSSPLNTVLQDATHHVTPMHLWVVRRRFQNIAIQQHKQYSYEPPLARWKKNFSKLYARRLLEAAAAAAATRQFITQMEQRIEGGVYDKPADWQNWERKDWTDELLQNLGRSKLSRFWAAMTRLVSLTCLAAPLAILYPFTYVSSSMESVSWSYALWSIEHAGPTFLKLAQWATTRHDLFSPEFCQYFGKLRDDTVGHSWKETQRILQQNLGIVADHLTLDTEPIGSGCIAQVYHGQLVKATGQYPAGTEVAIKVEHPGIWDKVCVDFYIMGKVARFLERVPLLNLKYLSLVDTVTRFRDIMLPQLDLTIEAKNLDRFNRDFSSDPRVSFPRPIHGLTTPHVLTETFIHGRPILDYAKADMATRKELAYLGLETTLKMIFLNDFLHGDLHPGNILVSKDPKSGEWCLHLLDCGIVVEMGPEQHVNVVKILGAFTRQDGYKAGRLMVDTSSDCQASDKDVELFVEGIANIVEADKANNFVEKVGDYIVDICFMACRRKVKLEASFVSAALAVEIMEGIASALYPDLRVVPVALPLVIKAEMMHRLPKFSLW